MPSTLINGVDLYYEIHGRGTPLLLVAGLASDCQSWQPIIEELSRYYLVITPDNRGVGRTRPQEIAMTIQQVADDCITLVKKLGLSSVNVVGHSMGGFVGMALAIRSPEIINKLILVGTSASNSKRNTSLFFNWASCLESGMDLDLWFRNIFYWLYSVRFFEDEAAVNDAVRYAIEYPYPQSAIAFRNQVKAIANFDCTEDLFNVTAKTMIICGKEDLLFPPHVCARLADAISGAAFSVIDNAAHSVHMEQPQVFADCVLKFLRQGQ